MTQSLRVQAPGKLMLAGEYAVLGPAGEALAVAVHPCLEVEVQPSERWSLVRSDQDLTWTEGEPVPQALAFAHTALQQVREASTEPMTPHRIITHAPSEVGDDNKRGFGSSASTVVAVTAALCAGPSTTVDKTRVLDLALQAHRAAQDGMGSGYDVATITTGGLVHWRPMRIAGAAAGGHEADRIEWPDGLHWLAGYSGQSASTTHFLKKLRAQTAEDNVLLVRELMALGRPVVDLIQAFRQGDVDAVLASVEACHHALAAWDRARSLGIMTPAIEAMIRGAHSVGAQAKVSGAGGGDSVVAFASDPAILDALAVLWAQEGFVPMPLALHLEGVSRVS